MFAYVARQAIYDSEKSVIAYELLFRDGINNCFPDISPDEATSNVLTGNHLSMGLEDISCNKLSFVNFHQDTLLYRFPSSLNPLSVVVEIVESVDVTHDLVKACKHLRNLGYQLALDDYDFSAKWLPLLPLVSYIKIEISEGSKVDLQKKMQELKEFSVKLVAEKIETLEEFEQYKALGFDYFQGYFLSRPEVVKHKKIEASIACLAELTAVSFSPNFNVDEINAILERDVGLSFMLMRFINNPMVNKRQKISSIRHALNYMGSVELKKFVALLAMSKMKGEKPIELVHMSLVRAKLCELISLELNEKNNPPISFIAGLFSFIDTLLDQTMTSLMDKLPVDKIVKSALCGENNPLRLQLQLAKAFEDGNWVRINELATCLKIDAETLYEFYCKAINWGHEMKRSFQ